ncbi:MAG: Pls/PosA family non-ribosomal peptide synthetase, partial [Dermatophilaceae bacterium]
TLTTGQHVPDGQHWHGCPAERTTVDYQRVPAAQVRWYRPVSYTIGQLAWLFLGPAPLLLGALAWYAVSSHPAIVGALLGPEQFGLGDLRFYGVLFGGTLALFVLGVPLGLLATFLLSRLTSLMLTPGRVYPLYGIHYTAQRWITRLTNRRFYLTLFGDSSYIVGYLSRLGYRLRPVLQTGTNFGIVTMQDSPRLCAVGTGTMISDGASFANAEYSSSSFRLGDVILGQRNYVGNIITLPTGARIGDNCLLATKVLVPLEGPVRENVGLLGSPAFEIPRTVNRDTRIAHLEGGRKARSGLAAKNRYNRRTMALFLLHRWFFATLVTLVLAVAFDASSNGGWWILPLTLTLLPFGAAWYLVFVERLTMGFKPLQPQHCSIYDSYFWLHERYWKLGLTTALASFDGTPFKSWFLRGLGARVGRRLLDDGSYFTDRSLASIGDDCTLNFHSLLQSHSLEDGVFKSDRITVGDFCTVGTNAFIHYGTTLGARAILGADSFLMKGEQIPPDGRWHGNPAGPDSREPAGADSTRQVTRR